MPGSIMHAASRLISGAPKLKVLCVNTSIIPRHVTCHCMSSLFGLSTLHLHRFFPYITASLLGRSPHNLIDIWVGGGVSEAGEIAQ